MLTGCIGNHSSEEKQEPATTQVIDNPVEEETESSAEHQKLWRQIGQTILMG